MINGLSTNKHKSCALLGGKLGDLSLIKFLKRSFERVILIGNEIPQFENVGFRHFQVDYSNVEEVYKILKDNRIGFIFPGCNDFAYRTASKLKDEFPHQAIDNYSNFSTIHHKDNFARFANQHGIPIPPTSVITDNNLNLNKLHDGPCIVKPINLSGGKGISKFQSRSDLLDFFSLKKNRNTYPNVIVQSYLKGRKHAVFSIISNQKIIFYSFDREYYYAFNEFNVGGALAPYKIESQISSKILYYLEKVANQLSLVDGVLHAQFIVNNGKPFFTDVTRRAPGDLYLRLLSLVYNIDFSEIYCQFLAGKSNVFSWFNPKPVCFVYRHIVFSSDKEIPCKFIVHENYQRRLIENVFIPDDSLMWKSQKSNKIGVIFLNSSGLIIPDILKRNIFEKPVFEK